MATPASRRRELGELLARIQHLRHPVIVAGDMNTNTHDAAPITLARELHERFGSGKWWTDEGITNALEYGTPFGWLDQATFHLFDATRGIHDPTARSVRWIGENPEAKFFTTLEQFRFADGAAFDFRGVAGHTSNGRTGKLADSNQRAAKGFEPTNELARTFGPAGVYKIDWIFVRPPHLASPRGRGQSFAFAPMDARTLQKLNHALPNRISDHNPILADIPLDSPPPPPGASGLG